MEPDPLNSPPVPSRDTVLLANLRSPELDIRGISTTFGNTKGETALQVARQAIGHLGGVDRTPIYEGSHTQGSPEWKLTQASAAIAHLVVSS